VLTDTQKSTSLIIHLQEVVFSREVDSHTGSTEIPCVVSESSGMLTGEDLRRSPNNVLHRSSHPSILSPAIPWRRREYSSPKRYNLPVDRASLFTKLGSTQTLLWEHRI